MKDTLQTFQREYCGAREMDAVAMVAQPQIGHVVDQLQMIRTKVPRPKPNEVAIKLAASAMHIDEIYAAQGTALGRFFGPKHVSTDAPYLMGSSVSGTVVAVGDQVSAHAIGDAVIVIPHHMGEIASWATYRCVATNMVIAKPNDLTHVQAAAINMASCVAYGAIEKAHVQPGQRCLVVGASGALGLLMVQFLKAQGTHVTGVCSGANAALVLSKGADAVIDYTERDFGETGKGQFDVVFDTIGGRDTERGAMRVLKRKGRFVTVVGPVQHIGKAKLSWFAFTRVIGHIFWRISTSLLRGPRYIFGERLPKKTIRTALNLIVLHNIRMPIDREIPFEIEAVKASVSHLLTHRAKGRIVINFQLPTAQPSAHKIEAG